MARIRKNPRNRRKGWYGYYKNRIRVGLEYCRQCKKCDVELTFGHLVAECNGGRITLDNITILCLACNTKQGKKRGHI